MRVWIALFVLLPLLSGCAERPPEVVAVEDIVAEAPELAQVVFENDFVRAVRFQLEPGDELPLHVGGPRVVYSLSDYRILFTEGEESVEKEWQAGEAHWHDAVDHAVENIGETEALFLVVTRTPVQLPGAAPYESDQDAAAADPSHAQVVFENDYVRVTKVTLAPGAEQPLHHGLNRLVYSLTSYQISYTSDQVEDVERAFNQGDAHWHGADEHAVTNIGETEARFVVFQFKG